MTIPYSGSLAMRLAGAEELIARTPAFQKKVGAANIDEAKQRIYGGEVTLIEVLEAITGGTLQSARPCVVIGVQMHAYQQIAQGGALLLGASGAVWVLFLDNPEQADDAKLSLLAFTDWVSQVTDTIGGDLVGAGDAATVGASDTTLWPYNGIRMFLEPLRPDVADRGGDDYWLCGYVFSDSINGGA